MNAVLDELYRALLLASLGLAGWVLIRRFLGFVVPAPRTDGRVFEEAGEHLGLEHYPAGLAGRSLLRGSAQGFSVEVSGEVTADERYRTTVTVSAKELPRRAAVELLDERTRSAALRIGPEQEAQAGDGRVCWSCEREPDSPGALVAWCRDVLAAAERLSATPMAALLAARAAGDPVPAVRGQCLEALVEHYPGHPETTQALEAGLAAADPRLRLHGALLALRHTDEHHLPGVRDRAAAALEELVWRDDVVEDVRVEALWGLVGALPEDRVRKAVQKASEGHRLLAKAAVEHALGTDLRYLLPRVRALARTDPQDDALALVLARYLDRFGDGSDEPALLTLLGVDDDEVRLAAIAGLRRHGTVRAVESLLALEGGAAADAARDAVRAIQARLGDADAGRLSVVQEAAGAGAVSLEASRAPDAEREKGA